MNWQDDKDYFKAAYKSRYKMLRKEKRCVMCTNQDERTLNGKCRCEKCHMKDKMYQHKRYHNINGEGM
jgi:hypothetical protein